MMEPELRYELKKMAPASKSGHRQERTRRGWSGETKLPQRKFHSEHSARNGGLVGLLMMMRRHLLQRMGGPKEMT